MKSMLFALAALAAGCTLASSAPAMAAAAKNYDCSKPGNANKAVCKNGSKDAIKGSTKPKEAKTVAPKAAKAEAKATPAKADAKTKPEVATASTERHYDCSKAGNANKAACKGAAVAAAKPAAKPAAMPKAAPKPKATPAAASTENNNPAGAIAQCKDGTYSHAKNRTGACSRHGGVAKWG